MVKAVGQACVTVLYSQTSEPLAHSRALYLFYDRQFLKFCV